jgi:hypothetical protein
MKTFASCLLVDTQLNDIFSLTVYTAEGRIRSGQSVFITEHVDSM